MAIEFGKKTEAEEALIDAARRWVNALPTFPYKEMTELARAVAAVEEERAATARGGGPYGNDSSQGSRSC